MTGHVRQSTAPSVRLAEIIAALSLATDLGTGFPMEHALRSCLLATRLARELGLGEQECADVYYVALLRYAGCSADSHFTAAVLGDEVAIGGYFATADPNRMADVFGVMFRHVGEGLPPFGRVRLLASTFAAGMRVGPQGSAAHAREHCEAAQLIAERLGFGPAIRQALGHAFEQWDGKGRPHGVKGEEIALPMRIVILAENANDFYQVGGVEAAVAMARERSGRMYDPAIVARFCERAPALLACLETESAWDVALADEPGTRPALGEAQLDTAAQTIADFADLKSPYTIGHSRGVVALATRAAEVCKLPAHEVTATGRAALLHDLGRVGVTIRIWDKAGPLTQGEWERVRLHPYYTERVLARSPALAPLGTLAALHHERLDGSGYHRNLPATLLPPGARILAAADTYHALTEPRPHRPARTPDTAAETLRDEVRAGRLDGEAANAVLVAAGHRVRQARKVYPAGLSEREVAVLRLLVRGLSNREMGDTLSISKVTVGHHIQHIYDKIGVSTRAAATLFAMQHDLLHDAGHPPGKAE